MNLDSVTVYNNFSNDDEASWLPTRPRRTTNSRATGELLIVDTGRGLISTITPTSWLILQRTNQESKMTSYIGNQVKILPIVNGCTKAIIPGRLEPIILVVNHATLLDDQQEQKLLLQPFQTMRHGVTICMIPQEHAGRQHIKVEGETIPLEYDGEKLFIRITKPTMSDLDEFEWFELTSPYPMTSSRPRRQRQEPNNPTEIPLLEWRKRLAWCPEDIVRRTLENTTCLYQHVECENREDPRRHLKSRFPGLRLKRQREEVHSDTFFPSHTSNRGNTCSQFFVGKDSGRWEVYPMKSKLLNGTAL